MTEINTPAELEALPEGARILDTGMVAVKRDGAWWYPDGQPWEPEGFPVELLED